MVVVSWFLACLGLCFVLFWCCLLCVCVSVLFGVFVVLLCMFVSVCFDVVSVALCLAVMLVWCCFVFVV